MDHDITSVQTEKEEYLPLWKSKTQAEDSDALVRRRDYESNPGVNWLLQRSTAWIHGLLIASYTLAFFVLLSSRDTNTSLVYSPAKNVLSYVPKTISVLYNDSTNLFLQDGGIGVDSAWSDLLKNLNIRFTADEMRQTGRNSVQLNDGTGDYLASLDVYHQLHCLRYLRSYVDEKPLPSIRVEAKHHAYHCIELLRQVIQCHGDVSVLTYDWLPGDKVPMPRWEIEHECVDWEALDGWAAARRVNLTSEAMIIHPSDRTV